jgi:hypothetical protein
MSLRLLEAEYRALCRIVLDRDQWKCRKCGYRQNLHVHHIIYRSQQGVDASWNLITLCYACHANTHGGDLYIEVAEGNFVGEGGGADGKIEFSYWED